MITAQIKFTVDPSQMLDGLRRQVAQNILRKAIRRATNTIKEDVKSNSPTKTGTYAKSIGVKIGTKKGGLIVYGVVGPRRGYKKIVDGRVQYPAKYAPLLEGGRAAVSIVNKRVLSDGSKFYGKSVAPASPVKPLGNAWSGGQDRYVQIMVDTIKTEVDAYFAKGGK